MKTSDFNYKLPPEFIAQHPIEPRDASRLLVLRRDTGSVEHAIFRDIGRFLLPGDLLVLNQTRVIPARVYARKLTGGRVEILLLNRREPLIWEVMVGGKGLLAGRQILIENGPEAEIIAELDGSRRLISFKEPIEPHLDLIGHIPLPPYIHSTLADPERYQTVYSRTPGSAAAPTAGLHFTPRLLEELKEGGVQLATITLHVGLDTFAPVTEDNPAEHKIHSEWCEMDKATADSINRTRRSGKRVIAVGTTSVRTIESALTENGTVIPFTGNTRLFITPGYQFKMVECMVTNFHLPKSTLLMLVSAFAGRELILNAYEIAKQERYRFYSFGDAMLIL